MIDEPLSRLEPYVWGDGTKPHYLTRKQALDLHEELLRKLPNIIASVRDALRKDSVQFGSSPREDAQAVGEWLVARSRLVPAVRPNEPNPFWEDEPTLSIPTQSACCRVAYFFGECLRSAVPTADWLLDTSDKRHVHYHQTVLRVPGSKEILEPVGVVLNLVRLRLIDHHPCSLGEFFDSWVDTFSQV